MSESDFVKVNGSRLWSRLMAMAVHGQLPNGGCNRQALTDEDRAGRELFIDWCRQIDCDVRIDAIGNIFARREGTEPGLPPVITGSHLDTQPSGGKFDGIYGVLGGLEVLETLQESGMRTRRPLEVVVWTNEEGCRFDTAMMGSAVWTGAMSREAAYQLADRSGHTVKQELLRIGHLGACPAEVGPVHAALELHIEQGPVLEACGETIGVVTGVQYMSRHRIVISGQEAHAGPTPMTMRKDPVMALAAILPALYRMAGDHGPDGRLTFGFLQAEPGSSNTVPGRLEITADIRHPVAENYRAMLREFATVVDEKCATLGLPVQRECFWEAPGIVFDERCVEAVRRASDAYGYTARDLCSGAGHDACNLSAVVPTSMIFIPCEGGLSHNEAENISPEHAEAGANVLLGAMVELAGAGS